MTKRYSLYFVLMLALTISSLSTLVSCNKDNNDDDDVYTYSTSAQTTLVTGFALQADADVLASLDSVHFTIDYDNGQIYNADSLPVGTDISALKVTVDFLNTVNSAVFTITGATYQADTTINYTTSMTQSLDFTGKTMLTVTSADQTLVKDYEVKVLVHKVNPDSLVWPMTWRRDLPGSGNGVQAHKTVKQGSLYRSMAFDGTTCTLLTATTPNQGTWEKQTLTLPFTPMINSLAASDDALFILATDGVLYTSSDGTDWTSCGVTWHSLLGAYEDRALGIVSGTDGYCHDEFPRPADFTAVAVEDGFPVAHSSGMIVTDNKWTVSQQAILVGGVDSNGEMVANVWGYDGKQWGKINSIHSSSLPAIADATLFPYYTYRTLSGVRRYALQPTWFVMGGRLANGQLNDNVYLSNTQGITWSVGSESTVQASHMTPFYGAQAFVFTETLTAASGASNLPRRISSFDSTWSCPFVYLFGGYNGGGELLPYVWRGVYIRMTNYPVY